MDRGGRRKEEAEKWGRMHGKTVSCTSRSDRQHRRQLKIRTAPHAGRQRPLIHPAAVAAAAECPRGAFGGYDRP